MTPHTVSSGLPPGHRPIVAAGETSDAFGRFVLTKGLVDTAALERAMRAASTTGERFDRALVSLGLLPEAILRQALAEFLALDLADPRTLTEAVVTDTVTLDVVRSRRILPLMETDAEIVLGIVDPLDDEPAAALAFWTGKHIIRRIVAQADFDDAVARLYTPPMPETDDGVADALEPGSETDAQRLRDMASEAPVVRFVNALVAEAVKAHASDIHIEPTREGADIRLRIDGDLCKGPEIPAGMRAAITSRIKIMAKLDIAERRLPQDGRVKAAVGGIELDFRVSTLPTAHGENVVLRILDRTKVALDFARLGLTPTLIDPLVALIERPNGIVLVTGPTGSGKTTTLYAALERRNRPNTKLFTVEDPIEYQIGGVSQVQVLPAIGLDFPRCLRAILRQDPDIVMIGEIRDLETARIAVQASLTGHLVFSTLHTNGAAASITRLIDMGVERYLLASTVHGILAQRLVRRLCPACAQPDAASNSVSPELRDLAQSLTGEPGAFRKAIGCSRCRGTGFQGRLAIAELLVVDADIRTLVLAAGSEAALDAAARRAGMRPIFHDGLVKAATGQTTIGEVFRAARTG